MKYIIDTHIFIWATTEPKQLSINARKILEENTGNVYLSSASIWELAIKSNIGKLEFTNISKFVKDGCKALNCKILPIQSSHLFKVESLYKHEKHKDPFDRLIIAQSIVTKYTVVTVDAYFKDYNIKLVT